MKFTVAQSSLATALSIVTKAIDSSTVPVLSGILIKGYDGTLELQATDLVVSIRHCIAANIEEPGSIVIPGKFLQSLVRTLPDAAVSFEEVEHTVIVRCGKSTYRLNTLNPKDFPEFPEYNLDDSVELPRDVLSEMVDKVYKVTTKDKSRPLLQGINLTVENNLVRLVATDSFRLAVCDTSVETATLTGSFAMLVPGMSFHDVLSIPTDSPTILIGSADSQIVFTLGNTVYVTRKIEGNFPDYQQLLPPNCETTVKIPIDEFTGALRRVSAIAASGPSIRYDVDVENQVLTLSALSPDLGEIHEQIDTTITGKSLVIGMNYQYVADCVAAVSGQKEIDLELQESSRPGIFKTYGKIQYLYLVMPVRL